jgi:RNA polymerase sigma factor (sigma-70 family)
MIQAQPHPEPVAPTGEVHQLADHLFRTEAAKLISVLTAHFGLDRLQLVEDVVQEALVRAIQSWPFYGVPKNPAAWLTQTAKNLALDQLRREKNFHEKQPQIITTIENWTLEPEESPAFDEEIKHDRLRLMFACCHPLIPLESQTALALKTLCAFSPAEIAAAFLTSEAAVEKRLVRARQKIREHNIPFEVPSGPEAAPRLQAVHQTIYLLFNEGYKASSGDSLIRAELCAQAIQLATHLVGQPVGNQPSTHALLALMLLNASRLPARTDDAGNILRLQDQDRGAWDKAMIARGLRHLALAATGSEVTTYHLQAAITACHCTAPDFQSTDWSRILGLYDHLIQLDNTPITQLNRAVALAQVEGPKAALEVVELLAKPLDDYYLHHAVLAELHIQLKNSTTASTHLERAIKLTRLNSERQFLQEKLRACEAAQ